MSNINELVLFEVTNSLVGAGIGGLGSRALTGIAAPMINSGLTSAGMSAIPGIGSVLSGGMGAAQQHHINNLQQQYNQLTGVNQEPSKIGNMVKTGLTGVAASVPILGGVVNAWKGAQIARMNDKISKAQDYQRYANLVGQMPR